MKILNAYACIGGNRKLWPKEHQVTAVEICPDIAAIYKDLYPQDEVIVGDAHEFILNHFKEFDFIWSSPPCPTHSRTNFFLHSQGVIRYPDMKLWQEVIFLRHFFKGKYCVENVISYYEPVLNPQISGRHYFWSNLKIPKVKYEAQIGRMCGTKETLNGKSTHQLRKERQQKIEIDLSKYNYPDKEGLLRNIVEPGLGLEILRVAESSYDYSKINQIGLFTQTTTP